jgi:UDP-glucose 4-epimerase
VTGGAGFIGSHVVEALLARGDEVTVVDDLSNGKQRTSPTGRGHVVRDIREGLAEVFRRARPELACHHRGAGRRARLGRPAEHDASVNVLGTIAVLEAARVRATPQKSSSARPAAPSTRVRRPCDGGLGAHGRSRLRVSKLRGGVPGAAYQPALRLASRLAALRERGTARAGPARRGGCGAISSADLAEESAADLRRRGFRPAHYVYAADVAQATLAAAGHRRRRSTSAPGIETIRRGAYEALPRVAGRRGPKR